MNIINEKNNKKSEVGKLNKVFAGDNYFFTESKIEKTRTPANPFV